MSRVATLLCTALDRVKPAAQTQARYRAEEVRRHGDLVLYRWRNRQGIVCGPPRLGVRQERSEGGKVRGKEVEGDEGGKEGGADRVRVDVDCASAFPLSGRFLPVSLCMSAGQLKDQKARMEQGTYSR